MNICTCCRCTQVSISFRIIIDEKHAEKYISTYSVCNNVSEGGARYVHYECHYKSCSTPGIINLLEVPLKRTPMCYIVHNSVVAITAFE